MGFYINTVAKKDCADQINELWNQQFGGFLVYTSSIIQKEIDYIQTHDECIQQRYIKTVHDWNECFSISKENHGQVFLAPYDDESGGEKQDFEEDYETLKSKVKFLLSQRFLFDKITNLDEANDVFDNLNFDGDYIENGRPKHKDELTFDKLEQPHNDPIFQKCLKLDNPELWSLFLGIYKIGVNKENWNNIRDFTTEKYSFENIWQRCNSIFTAKGLKPISSDSDTLPSIFDIKNSFLLSSDEFESYLNSIRTQHKYA